MGKLKGRVIMDASMGEQIGRCIDGTIKFAGCMAVLVPVLLLALVGLAGLCVYLLCR